MGFWTQVKSGNDRSRVAKKDFENLFQRHFHLGNQAVVVQEPNQTLQVKQIVGVQCVQAHQVVMDFLLKIVPVTLEIFDGQHAGVAQRLLILILDALGGGLPIEHHLQSAAALRHALEQKLTAGAGRKKVADQVSHLSGSLGNQTAGQTSGHIRQVRRQSSIVKVRHNVLGQSRWRFQTRLVVSQRGFGPSSQHRHRLRLEGGVNVGQHSQRFGHRGPGVVGQKIHLHLLPAKKAKKYISLCVCARAQIRFARAHCFASGEGCSSGGKVVLAPGPPP